MLVVSLKYLIHISVSVLWRLDVVELGSQNKKKVESI